MYTVHFRPREKEGGFTLVEILVVIIIIGILAAIAIPIFLNQQRAARDSATIQDVRNLATNVESALVSQPEAVRFSLAGAGPDATEAQVRVGEVRDGGVIWSETLTISKTKGTMLVLNATTVDGEPLKNADDDSAKVAGAFVLRGYNADGQEYTSRETAATYVSMAGGFQ